MNLPRVGCVATGTILAGGMAAVSTPPGATNAAAGSGGDQGAAATSGGVHAATAQGQQPGSSRKRVRHISFNQHALKSLGPHICRVPRVVDYTSPISKEAEKALFMSLYDMYSQPKGGSVITHWGAMLRHWNQLVDILASTAPNYAHLLDYKMQSHLKAYEQQLVQQMRQRDHNMLVQLQGHLSPEEARAHRAARVRLRQEAAQQAASDASFAGLGSPASSAASLLACLAGPSTLAGFAAAAAHSTAGAGVAMHGHAGAAVSSPIGLPGTMQGLVGSAGTAMHGLAGTAMQAPGGVALHGPTGTAVHNPAGTAMHQPTGVAMYGSPGIAGAGIGAYGLAGPGGLPVHGNWGAHMYMPSAVPTPFWQGTMGMPGSNVPYLPAAVDGLGASFNAHSTGLVLPAPAHQASFVGTPAHGIGAAAHTTVVAANAVAATSSSGHPPHAAPQKSHGNKGGKGVPKVCQACGWPLKLDNSDPLKRRHKGQGGQGDKPKKDVCDFEPKAGYPKPSKHTG